MINQVIKKIALSTCTLIPMISLILTTSCNQTNQVPDAATIAADLEANYHPQLKPEWKTLTWSQYQNLTTWVFNDPPVTGSYRNLLQALVVTPQGFYQNRYPANALKITIAKRDLIAYSDHIDIKLTIWSAGDPNALEATTSSFKIKVNVILT